MYNLSLIDCIALEMSMAWLKICTSYMATRIQMGINQFYTQQIITKTVEKEPYFNVEKIFLDTKLIHIDRISLVSKCFWYLIICVIYKYSNWIWINYLLRQFVKMLNYQEDLSLLELEIWMAALLPISKDDVASFTHQNFLQTQNEVISLLKDTFFFLCL